MIELLRTHATVRTARVLIVIGMAADFVRTAADRKAGVLAIGGPLVRPVTETARLSLRPRIGKGRASKLAWTLPALPACLKPRAGARI
jgi:hypothetical protein